MKRATRREFLKSSITAAAGFGLPNLVLGGDRPPKGDGAGAEVRIGIVGLGDVAAVGGVGGRGHQHIHALRDVPGARIVALCDVDSAHLERESTSLKDRGVKFAVYRDIRKLLDDKNIDAVVVATPNHWHALATIWACQAGKDVYVEKPLAYNIWEGRQMVTAARKYGRMVQVGTQSRSSPAFTRLPVSPQRSTRRDPLGPRHRLPPPRGHRQSQRADAAVRPGRLRPLVRPGAESAVDAQATALRMALVLVNRQRRDWQQRHPRY